VETGGAVNEIGGWGPGYIFDTPNITNSVITSNGQVLFTYEYTYVDGFEDVAIIYKRHLPDGQLLSDLQVKMKYQELSASPDGSLLATVRGVCPSDTDKCTLEVRNSTTGEILVSVEDYLIEGVVFSQDNRYFAFYGVDEIQVWDIAEKQKKLSLADPWADVAIQFSHNGKLLAASTPMGLYFRVWDLETGTQLTETTSQKHPELFYFSTMAFSPDDRRLAIAINDIVGIWYTATWSEGESWRWLEFAPISAIAYSKDGSLIAVGGEDGSIVLGTSGGQKLADLSGHTTGIKQVVFSPDGKYLISSSWDGTLRFWGVPAK
jgi:WD40 repeat protein